MAPSPAASRSLRANNSTPRSRILAWSWSCSYWARSTQSTSSNSSSSWVEGVRRCRLSSGRWTMTLRSLPTSEWTPNVWNSCAHRLGPGVAVDDRLDLVQAADRAPLPVCSTNRTADSTLGKGLDCASAVIGSPRFSSALPPSAITTLIAGLRSLAECGAQLVRGEGRAPFSGAGRGRLGLDGDAPAAFTGADDELDQLPRASDEPS